MCIRDSLTDILFPSNLDLEPGSEDVYFQVLVREGGNRYDIAVTFPAWLDPQRQLPPGSIIPPNNTTGSVRVQIPGWGSVSYYSATYYQAALRGAFLFTPQANVARDFAPTLQAVSDSRDRAGVTQELALAAHGTNQYITPAILAGLRPDKNGTTTLYMNTPNLSLIHI